MTHYFILGHCFKVFYSFFFEGKRFSFSRCFALEIATTLLSHSDMKSGD